MEDETENIPLIKIILAGDSGVGKTYLISKFMNNAPPKSRLPTIGVELVSKKIQLSSGNQFRAQIWDTAGQEKYHSVVSSYYRRAQGAIVVYDISKASTFHKVLKWIQAIRLTAKPDISILIVGNKIDLDRSSKPPSIINTPASSPFQKPRKDSNEKEKFKGEVSAFALAQQEGFESEINLNLSGQKSPDLSFCEGDSSKIFQSNNPFYQNINSPNPPRSLNSSKLYLDTLNLSGINEQKRQREVSFQEGLELASKYNCGFIETSAYDGTNVSIAFEGLFQNIMDKYDKEKDLLHLKNKVFIETKIEDPPKNKKSNCCFSLF